MYKYYNPSPIKANVGDCVVRALCAVLDQDWDTTYTQLALEGFMLKDMPDANKVWASYLERKGFKRYFLDDTCPFHYTIEDFAEDHSNGKFVIGTGDHAVAVINGEIWDTWKSGEKIPLYFFAERTKY